ncbi:hypothetical protein EDB84DRAFT_1677896 [Lactarius hengduanensis]|nr:hypothetical protein EDB84DRAFT_1677896 [Lactarius hengduanensis]
MQVKEIEKWRRTSACVDPRCLNFLSEYLGFRRGENDAGVTECFQKVVRSESVMMRKKGFWKRYRSSGCCVCEISRNEEGNDATYWSYDNVGMFSTNPTLKASSRGVMTALLYFDIETWLFRKRQRTNPAEEMREVIRMDACSSGVSKDDRSSTKSEDNTLTIVGPSERTHGGSPRSSNQARTLNPKRPSILRTKDSPKIWGTSLIPLELPNLREAVPSQ